MENNLSEVKNKVWVLGYYGKRNFGDECFKHVFQNYLSDMNHPNHPNNEITYAFFNPEEPLPLPVPSDVRCIIVGGGDIINQYFFNKLRPIFVSRPCPIYAVGVGFPYPKLIDEGFLDHFDYVVHRTETCHESVKKAIGENRVHFTPDLAWLMSTGNSDHSVVAKACLKKGFLGCLSQPKRVKPNTKRIAVCLARPMRNKEDDKPYYNIVEGIATFLFGLAKQKYFTSNKRTIYGTESVIVSPPTIDPDDGVTILKEKQLSDTDKKKRKKKKQKNKHYLYQIDFIPFGTSDTSPNEDDRYMQQDVLNVMHRLNQNNVYGNVTLYTESPEDPVDFFSNYDYALCSRFHAHIFALSANVPVISFSCTKKVKDLMEQAGLQDYTYTLPVHPEKFYPVSCDAQEIEERFFLLQEREQDVRNQIKTFGKNMREKILLTSRIVRNMIYYLPQPETRYQQTRPADYVANFISKTLLPGAYLPTLYTPGGLKKVGLKEKHLDRLVRLISFLVVGKPVSSYNYGLREQILSDSYHLRESCKWIHNHYVKECVEESNEFPNVKKYFQEGPNSFFSMTKRHGHVDFEHLRGPLSMAGGKSENVHRSGWDYVCFNLFTFQDPCAEEIFDTYLDETFGWRYEVLRDAGKIPYTKPWRGILHHTPEEQFSENNLVRQFKRAAWRESLKHCRGLITLSEHLAKWVRVQLVSIGFSHVEVHHLKHPTQFPFKEEEMFSFCHLDESIPKKVVQVGGWLRNTYAIFDLPVVSYCGFRKCALKGKGMDHYYLTHEQFKELSNNLANAWDTQVIQRKNDNHGQNNGNHESGHMTGGGYKTPPKHHGKKTGHPESPESVHDESPSCLVDSDRYTPFGQNSAKKLNNVPNVPMHILQHISPYIMGARQAALEGLKKRHQSVTMLDFVTNEAYDTLLAESIVFINLVDASACNTILECIARATPILVNPLPAVVEYLGVDYPLYYTEIDEAAYLLTKRDKLEEAHQYLKHLDTIDLTVESFGFAFNQVIKGEYEEPRFEPKEIETLEEVVETEKTKTKTTSKKKNAKSKKVKKSKSIDMIDVWVKSIDKKVSKNKTKK